MQTRCHIRTREDSGEQFLHSFPRRVLFRISARAMFATRVRATVGTSNRRVKKLAGSSARARFARFARPCRDRTSSIRRSVAELSGNKTCSTTVPPDVRVNSTPSADGRRTHTIEECLPLAHSAQFGGNAASNSRVHQFATVCAAPEIRAKYRVPEPEVTLNIDWTPIARTRISSFT